MAVFDVEEPPAVHSVSYYGNEIPGYDGYYEWLDLSFALLGARGISVLFCSGDNGVMGYAGHTYTNASQCGSFLPSFPASSPHVTAVGATEGPEFGLPEQACTTGSYSSITTGGGFSNHYPTPAYQKQAVAQYLASASLPPAALFNASGRGFPDVAFMGNYFPIVLDGATVTLCGTSASACARRVLIGTRDD